MKALLKPLRITMVQAPLAWEAPVKNIKHITAQLTKVRKGSTDLILLPEMFNTGFTMNTWDCAETMNGETVSWMKEISKKKDCVVSGSLIIKEKGKYYNRLVWVQPDGVVLHYSKRHLFRMAKEHNHFSAGNKRLIVNIKGWRVCPLVCYDLRFPVWSRNNNEFDLLLYVANWPARRKYAWKQLLIARAIENQCFVAGLNRVGKDGKGIQYNGDSVVLDPLGIDIGKIPSAKATTKTITINYKMLQELRKSFPLHMDADKFKIVTGI